MSKYGFISRNIKAEMQRREISPEEMALNMKISKTTLYRKMCNPEELTVDNLDDASKLLKVSIQDLLTERR